MGAFFHPECFRCHACGYPITEHEVSPLISKYFHYIQFTLFWCRFIKCCTIDFQMKFLSVFHFWIKFSLSGRDTYHKSCFKELTHPKCEVCHQFVSKLSLFSQRCISHLIIDNQTELSSAAYLQIPTNGVGLIEYRCHPFWSQKYCPSHEHDNTARCCSCERLEVWIFSVDSFRDT